MQREISQHEKVSAVVIGLGAVGSRFDEDPGRKAVWSHVGAYLARADLFTLAGACERDKDNAAAFAQRCPSVPVWTDVAELIARTRPEVVSICTPTPTHPEILAKVLEAPGSEAIKVVWCEKPLAPTLEAAQQMVEACARRSIMMVVSYNRRWLPIWRRAREMVMGGELGCVRTIRVAMPNRLFSIGSHAADLMGMLGGPIADVVAMKVPELEQGGEPACMAMVRFASGVAGILEVTGLQHNLVVEAQIMGDAGRAYINEIDGVIIRRDFEDSPSFQGYCSLGAEQREDWPTPDGFSAFVAIAEEVAALCRNPAAECSCSGDMALQSQTLLQHMLDHAQ